MLSQSVDVNLFNGQETDTNYELQPRLETSTPIEIPKNNFNFVFRTPSKENSHLGKNLISALQTDNKTQSAGGNNMGLKTQKLSQSSTFNFPMNGSNVSEE